VLLVSLGLPACESVLDPTSETEMVFSIFGHLDAAADTQWVRVAPFRGSIFSTPDPIDAAVTIEELGTGRTFEMTPILFSQESPNFGDTLYAYTFFTTEPIHPEADYRLTARRSDGGSSSATVRTPPEFPDLPIIIGYSQRLGLGFSDYVRFQIPPGAHLAMVQTYVPGLRLDLVNPVNCPHHSGYNDFPTPPAVDVGGELQVNIRPPGPSTPPMGCGYGPREVRIVLSGQAWQPDPGYDVSHINAVDNIENGVGFLAGVITKRVPYRDACSITGTGSPNFCEISHGLGSSSLEATVVDGFPLGIPGTFAPIAVLRMLGETWGFRPLISTFVAPDQRSYEFDNLLPGRYILRIDVRDGPVPLPFYCVEKPLDLVAGENFTEIVMVRIDSFPNEPVNANGCREG